MTLSFSAILKNRQFQSLTLNKSFLLYLLKQRAHMHSTKKLNRSNPTKTYAGYFLKQIQTTKMYDNFGCLPKGYFF